jgi:hypothetical protein
MWERGCFPPTILAQPRRPCRPRHPYAVPRTSLQCVCTQRRNCIEQLSPPPEYAPGTGRFLAVQAAIIKLTHYPRAGSGVSLINDPDEGAWLTELAFRALGPCRSLLFPKGRSRPHVSGLPIEEIIKAGPCVDLGLANLAFETAGTPLRVLLFCRRVIEPAIGAGEMFGRPYAAGHPINMRGASPIFQYRTLPQLMTHYPRKGLAPVWGLLPINLRPHRPTRIKIGCCSWP